MVLCFLQNACILITFMSLSQHFLKDRNISKNLSLRGKIFFGLYSGLIGIILLINSVHITANIIIDFRYIPILISALYGGFLPSIITSFIIGIFRLLFLGISNASINGLIVALLIGNGFGFIAILKLSKKVKLILGIPFFIIVMTISSWIALKDITLIIHTMSVFFCGYFIVSYFSIKYAEYIIETFQMYQKFKNEATKDYLTGLNNVRQFDTSFNSISQLTLRNEEDLSLLLIDIDFFKKINDTYGHNAGDNVLKSLAAIFLNTCSPYDVVSRNGGEEFSIILLNCSASEAIQFAERLRKMLKRMIFTLQIKIL